MKNNIDWQEFNVFSQECRKKYIPVIREQSAKILCDLIEKHQPKSILELGTAVGYSGTLMLLSAPNSKLVTVDINQDMCQKAQDTFKKYNVFDRVQVVCDDALNFLQNCDQKFDFVFVDGPKGQYIKYLPYFKQITKKGSIIFCDDVLYFGMIQDDSKVIHKKITIVRNLREFLTKAQSDESFESQLLQVEDGILILERK